MKILIADDNQTSLKLLKAQLEAEGYQVLTAVDGVEALALLQRETVDAVISDILMPRMHGYRLCYEVRRDERLCHLPFIFYTSTCTSKTDENLSIELTADAFLRKPASPKTIIETLRSIPARQRVAAPRGIEPIAELELMKEYSERLVAKLEEKNAELQQQTEVLRANEARLLLQAVALETAANAITITDPKGAILWVNPAFTALTGYSQEEVLGKTPRVLKSGNHDQAFYRDFWKTITSGQTWRGEFTNRRKDGNLYYGEQTITPVRSQEGEITHFVGIMNDVTEAKKLREQFIQSQKMEVIGHLASGVAHDFNNILAVIMGYSDLMNMSLGPEHELQKYCSEVRHAADRASALTQQLLIFSRKQKLQPAVLDLNKILSNIEKMLRRLVDESITLTITPGKEIGRFKADSNHIGQILMNLVVNARDAMPKGGKLTIETRKVTLDETCSRSQGAALPGEYVMLMVTDSGIGMTDEVKSRLFEPFFTTKPEGKGTGLGLATCMSIVKQSRGHIDFQSDLGHGTTFRVYFPCVDQPVDAQVEASRPAALPRGTETLLLVEDERSLLQLANEVLEAQGYTVLHAANGRDALNLARDHSGSPIRLVITDVIMPIMGGKAMAEWLQATYPGLKVLFTSGYTDDAIAHDGVLDQGVAFLPKPYTPAALVRKVRELLDAKPAPDSACADSNQCSLAAR